MTEGGHATFTMDPEAARTRPGAVGPADTAGRGPDRGRGRRPCPTGEVGEVLTRNPEGHREYYKDPEATARQWAGGWLHTGDLGHLDADGYLYIVGRKKEMIVRGRDERLRRRRRGRPPGPPRRWWRRPWSGVPHEVLGEDVAAYVVLRPGLAATTDELIAFVGERLADYKVPRRVVLVAELPRNAGGKVVKAQLGSATVAARSEPAR